MKVQTHRFNLYEDQVRLLKELAKRRNVTYSTILREALDQYLQRKGCGRRPARPIVRR